MITEMETQEAAPLDEDMAKALQHSEEEFESRLHGGEIHPDSDLFVSVADGIEGDMPSHVREARTAHDLCLLYLDVTTRKNTIWDVRRVLRSSQFRLSELAIDSGILGALSEGTVSREYEGTWGFLVRAQPNGNSHT